MLYASRFLWRRARKWLGWGINAPRRGASLPRVRQPEAGVAADASAPAIDTGKARHHGVDNRKISSYNIVAMRRRGDKRIPIELEILRAARVLRERGTHEFHGYLIARQMRSRKAARLLTGYGTLYKALARLEAGQFLGSRWEEPAVAAREGRPRRRLYYLTGRVLADQEGVPISRPSALGSEAKSK